MSLWGVFRDLWLEGRNQLKRDRFRRQNVLITGGSSGIGLATAVEFGKLGANLFLAARHKDRLAAAAQKIKYRLGSAVPVVTLPVDVGARAEMEAVVHRVGQQYGGLHTLINNAGMVLPALLADQSVEDMERVMQVNFWGMLYAVKAAWPYLTAAQHGHLGFVSSVAGYLGLIGYASYSPTKFAIAGLAECLRMEARDCGIGVTVVYPPDTDTPLLAYERAQMPLETRAINQTARVLSPEEVAKKFVRGMINCRFEVFCSFETRLYRWIRTLAPRLYFRVLDGVVARDRRKRGIS